MTPLTPLLEVNQLSIAFRSYNRVWEQEERLTIRNLSLSLQAGEILAVAGASGSGKSLLAEAILGILPENARAIGALFFRGQPLTASRQAALRGQEIALVPQGISNLDPLLPVGKQVRGPKGSAAAQRQLFRQLRLAAESERRYPFQLSGGQARRVLLATALISGADLLIADEPTPGLDLPAAVQALAAFRELANQGKGILLITHDLELALSVADRLAVFYAGTTLEITPAADWQAGPMALRHPYSRALWRALPENGFQALPGRQPAVAESGPGCPFAPRCTQANDRCHREQPPLRTLRGGQVRCFHAS